MNSTSWVLLILFVFGFFGNVTIGGVKTNNILYRLLAGIVVSGLVGLPILGLMKVFGF